jgi:hypothetical protein
MAGNQLILLVLQKTTLAAGYFDRDQSAAYLQRAFLIGRVFRLRGCCMRAPSERDQCQAKLNILVEGFMRDDMPTYRDALAWLRDFADQKNVERGRVMCGSYWYTPQDQQRQPTD